MSYSDRLTDRPDVDNVAEDRKNLSLVAADVFDRGVEDDEDPMFVDDDVVGIGAVWPIVDGDEEDGDTANGVGIMDPEDVFVGPFRRLR